MYSVCCMHVFMYNICMYMYVYSMCTVMKKIHVVQWYKQQHARFYEEYGTAVRRQDADALSILDTFLTF